jgi:glucose-6-phosphate 1-dehydrogenase
VLKANTPIYEYQPDSWGPAEVETDLNPPDGWHNPKIEV